MLFSETDQTKLPTSWDMEDATAGHMASFLVTIQMFPKEGPECRCGQTREITKCLNSNTVGDGDAETHTVKTANWQPILKRELMPALMSLCPRLF